MKMGRKIKYNITIEASDNEGFIVRAGCATFVFTSSNPLVADLKAYLDNPEKFEEQYGASCQAAPAMATGMEPPQGRPIGQ